LHKKNDKEIIIVDNNPLIGVNELTPKHFDNLQLILHKMNEYHFRHIGTFTWKYLSFWLVAVSLLQFFWSYYISGKSIGNSGGYLLVFNIFFFLSCGVLCVISKCLIRLYSFKHIAVRLLQSIFIFQSVDILSPFLLVLTKVNQNFEILDSILEVALVVGLTYFILYAFIPFKWLQRVTMVYGGIAIVLISSLMLLDSFSHYIKKDNELIVYSDLEKDNARDLSSIDSIIDNLTIE
jgi:hypothetical protein